MERLTPVQRQILELIDDVKRRGWGCVTVEIENGLVRRIIPAPTIPAQKDIDIRGEKCYTSRS